MSEPEKQESITLLNTYFRSNMLQVKKKIL